MSLLNQSHSPAPPHGHHPKLGVQDGVGVHLAAVHVLHPDLVSLDPCQGKVGGDSCRQLVLVESILDIAGAVVHRGALVDHKVAEARGAEEVHSGRWPEVLVAAAAVEDNSKIVVFFLTKKARQCSFAFFPNRKMPRLTPSRTNQI